MSTSITPKLTANTVLYKKSKDVKRLPIVAPSDVRRTLAGFASVPEFIAREDPRLSADWPKYKEAQRKLVVDWYWAAYDEEYQELEALWLQLKRKEAQEEEKRKSEAEKKKKSKPAVPVASGSGSKKGKGKEKEVQVSHNNSDLKNVLTGLQIIDSESDTDTDSEFRECCVGCERAKVRCVFTHAINGKKVACDRCVERKTHCTYRNPQDLVVRKELRTIRNSVSSMDVNSEVRNRLQAESFYHQYYLQVLSGLQWSLNALSNIDGQDIGLRTLDNQLPSGVSVPEDLQDAIQHGRGHVIERYNNIAHMCSAQMKSISSRYGLGKNFGARVPLLNRYGEVELPGEADSGIKKRKAEEAVAEPGPSKKARKEKEPGSGEEVVEKEVEKEMVPVQAVNKGKGKEGEPGSELETGETMKE
jgi:hypothetical protein